MTTKFIHFKDIPKNLSYDLYKFISKFVVPMVQKQLTTYRFDDKLRLPKRRGTKIRFRRICDGVPPIPKNPQIWKK